MKRENVTTPCRQVQMAEAGNALEQHYLFPQDGVWDELTLSWLIPARNFLSQIGNEILVENKNNAAIR